MIARIIIMGVFVALIAYVAISYQSLWVGNDKLTGRLDDSTRALGKQRIQLGKLKSQVETLRFDTLQKAGLIASLRGMVSDLKLSSQQAQTRYLQGRVSQQQLGIAITQQVAGLSARQKKAAADELVEGVGAVSTSVNDSVLNGQIASVKAKLKNLATVYVPSLEEANAQLSEQLIQERAKGQDLVTELNGARSTINQKNKSFNALQTTTQREIAKAQKGIIGPLLHGPRIKALSRVSDSISTAQK